MSTNSEETKIVAAGKRGRVSSALGFLEAVAGIIKTLTWPLVILFLFFQFRDPLGQIAQLLPTKLEQASKVSAGGLTLEIEKTARAAGNPELSRLIGGLSRRALEILLRTSRTESSSLASTSQTEGEAMIRYNLPSGQELEAMHELERKKLLDFGTPLDNWMSKLKRELVLQSGGGRSETYVASQGRNKLDENSAKLLWSAHYKHSELGAKAVELIIQSVSAELQKPPIQPDRQ
jgi:hypothetical protein